MLNRTLAYEVDRISVVKPDQTKELSVQPGKDLVTLRHLHAVRREHATAAGARPSRTAPYRRKPNTRSCGFRKVSSFTVYGFVATYGTLASAPASIRRAPPPRKPAPRITPPIGRIAFTVSVR